MTPDEKVNKYFKINKISAIKEKASGLAYSSPKENSSPLVVLWGVSPSSLSFSL